MIGQFYMLADGSRDNSRSLLFGFGKDKLAHDAAVVVVQVADGLVQKQEVKRLAECTDKGDTLLLSEREFSGFRVYFICDA